MPADDRAARVHDLAGAIVAAGSWRSTNPAVSPSGMKQISWLSGLSATARPSRARVRAHVGLRQMADGKQRVRELILRQREQEIRLVLVRVHAAQQAVPPPVLVVDDARVVAGRDGARRQSPAARSASVENFRSALQCTHGIGVRPAAYSATKWSTTVSRNCLLEDSGCSAEIRATAATRRASCRSSRLQHDPNASGDGALIVQLHRQADDVVAGLGEQAPRRPTNRPRRTWRRRRAWLAERLRRPPEAAQLGDEARQHADDEIDFRVRGRRRRG